jgi:hypothetical protein
MILLYPLLGLYPKKSKSAYNRDTCTPRLSWYLLLVMVKIWNQPEENMYVCTQTPTHDGVLFSHKEE